MSAACPGQRAPPSMAPLRLRAPPGCGMARPCSHRYEDGSACGRPVEGTFCAIHRRQQNRKRGSPTARGLGYDHQQARLRVLERDGHVCHWCGGHATTADHLLPRAQGGTSDDDNLVAACASCNSRRGATVRRTVDFL